MIVVFSHLDPAHESCLSRRREFGRRWNAVPTAAPHGRAAVPSVVAPPPGRVALRRDLMESHRLGGASTTRRPPPHFATSGGRVTRPVGPPAKEKITSTHSTHSSPQPSAGNDTVVQTGTSPTTPERPFRGGPFRELALAGTSRSRAAEAPAQTDQSLSSGIPPHPLWQMGRTPSRPSHLPKSRHSIINDHHFLRIKHDAAGLIVNTRPSVFICSAKIGSSANLITVSDGSE